MARPVLHSRTYIDTSTKKCIYCAFVGSIAIQVMSYFQKVRMSRFDLDTSTFLQMSVSIETLIVALTVTSRTCSLCKNISELLLNTTTTTITTATNTRATIYC